MPRSKTPRTLSTILGGKDGPLGRIHRRGEALLSLDRRLRDLLPPPLSEHCRVANVRGRSLIVHVDSAAWATQLRFLASQLAPTLLGREDAQLRVKIHPPDSVPTPPRRTVARPSATAAAELERTAERFRDDPLGRSLRRLARRGR